MSRRILVYGYGNPGRGDDGLGPEFVRRLESRSLPGVALDSGFQLQIDAAAAIAAYDAVVFVDADVACRDPFELRKIEPDPAPTWTSHSVRPEVVLELARQHFNCTTVAYILAIRGERFDDFGESLSPRAERNLQAALQALEGSLVDGSLELAAAGSDPKRS